MLLFMAVVLNFLLSSYIAVNRISKSPRDDLWHSSGVGVITVASLRLPYSSVTRWYIRCTQWFIAQFYILSVWKSITTVVGWALSYTGYLWNASSYVGTYPVRVKCFNFAACFLQLPYNAVLRSRLFILKVAKMNLSRGWKATMFQFGDPSLRSVAVLFCK